MSLAIVVGAPFAGKRLWIDRQIERAEQDGEVGTLALDYTSIYSAIVPGLASVYRDQHVSDSGAARFAAYLLAAAIREAHERELRGFAAVDSPRRAQALAAQLGGPVVEVVVSEQTALRRARAHVELVRELAPRATADETAAKCKQMVRQYFEEADVLPDDRRKVRAPEHVSDRAIQYMWSAAIRAAKAGDEERRDKWTAAARRALASRGIAA